MFTTFPIHQCKPTPPTWLIPDLLTHRSLVFLEGPSSIGKSLLAAAWAGYLHQHHEPSDSTTQHPPVLWMNGHHRTDLIAGYLHTHQVDPDHQPLHLLCESSLDENGNEADYAMLGWFWECLEKNHPRLVIIDSLEQVFPFLANVDEYRQRYFLNEIACRAQMNNATVVILQQSSAPAWLPAIQLSAHRRFQLSWHPQHQSSRVLTLLKCEWGDIGSQWQIDINAQGQASWQKIDDQNRLPQLHRLPTALTQARHPGPASCVHEIIIKLGQLLTQPTPAREIKAFLLEEGYTQYSIRTALNAAPIKTIKQGSDWWYHLPPPSCGVPNTPQLDNSTR